MLDRLLRRESKPVPSLAQPSDPSESRVGVPSDIDGRMGLLDGFGEHPARWKLVVRTRVGRRILTPKRLEDVHVIIGPPPSVCERHLDGAEFLLGPTHADTEVEPSAGDPIQGGNLAGQVDG